MPIARPDACNRISLGWSKKRKKLFLYSQEFLDLNVWMDVILLYKLHLGGKYV